MFSTRIGCVAVLLLVLIESSVVVSLDNGKNRTENSTDVIDNHLTLPWIDGIEWLAHSSDSSAVKEVKAFIRAVIAGETWAKQKLDTLWKGYLRLEERHISYSKLRCDRTEAKVGMDTDLEDEHCVASTVDGVYDPALLYKVQNDHIADEVVQSAPGGSKDFNIVEISTILFFSMIVVALLGCTICDFVVRNRPKDSPATIETLAKFSIYTNALALLNTKSTGEAMHAIHGLRCLGFFMVIIGHRYVVSAFIMNQQIMLLDYVKWQTTTFGVFCEMGTFVVDTFCVISGFLLAHKFFEMNKSGLQSNVFATYLYRYLRLTPCIAVLLLLLLVFSDRLGSGPTWDAVITHAVDPCRENWWINLLYLQNIVNPERICLLHTWYLGLDMQLFWLSPLILYPLYHSPKLGLRILSLFLLISVFTPTILLVLKGYSNLFLRLEMDFSKLVTNFSYYYMPTYNRACPHLVGILLGYDVATRRRHFTKVNVAINWIVTGLLILFCIWFKHCVIKAGFMGDWDVEIVAAILLRPFWSIAMAWIIYACTQGYGGLATKFLSLPIFFPLSRLSYCIYLVHIVIQTITVSLFYGSVNPSLISYMFNGISGDIVLSVTVALIFNLFIEYPSIVFAKILLSPDKRGCNSEPATPVKEFVKKLK